jgi:hypothetical protein
MNEIIWHLVAKLIRFDRCPVVAGLLKSREINGNFSKRIFLFKKFIEQAGGRHCALSQKARLRPC